MPRKLIRFISIIICIGFIFEQSGFAQVMPTQGTPLWSTLPTLRYLSVNSANPFNYFNFLLDRGDKPFTKDKLDVESRKLINYFFLGLTLPGESLWVNLKPDEPGRIISDGLAETDLGRFLLEQDLQLKKDVARYIHPAHPIGKEFWEKLYSTIGKDKVKKAEITTSNRVWIVPDEAVVVETEDGAFVASAKLKVLLESEYINLTSKAKHNPSLRASQSDAKQSQEDTQLLSETLMKEIILPPLTEEINKGATYAPLRQIYYSLILAEWFKRKSTQQGLSPQSLNTIQAKGTVPNPYIEAINKGYINGLESEFPWSKQKIWQDYVGSYQKGEYKQQAKIFGLRRMYFSGGVYLMFRSASPIDNANVPTNTINSPGVLKIIKLAELPKTVLPEIPLPVGEPTEVTIAPTVNKIQELAALIDSAVNKDLILVLGRNNSTTNATFGEAKIPLLRTEVLDLKETPSFLVYQPIGQPESGASLSIPTEVTSASPIKTTLQKIIAPIIILSSLIASSADAFSLSDTEKKMRPKLARNYIQSLRLKPALESHYINNVNKLNKLGISITKYDYMSLELTETGGETVIKNKPIGSLESYKNAKGQFPIMGKSVEKLNKDFIKVLRERKKNKEGFGEVDIRKLEILEAFGLSSNLSFISWRNVSGNIRKNADMAAALLALNYDHFNKIKLVPVRNTKGRTIRWKIAPRSLREPTNIPVLEASIAAYSAGIEPVEKALVAFGPKGWKKWTNSKNRPEALPEETIIHNAKWILSKKELTNADKFRPLFAQNKNSKNKDDKPGLKFAEGAKIIDSDKYLIEYRPEENLMIFHDKRVSGSSPLNKPPSLSLETQLGQEQAGVFIKSIFDIIINNQKLYLDTGKIQDLKPLSQPDIAEELGVNVSTVSRNLGNIEKIKFEGKEFNLNELVPGNKYSSLQAQDILEQMRIEDPQMLNKLKERKSAIVQEEFKRKWRERLPSQPLADRTVRKYISGFVNSVNSAAAKSASSAMDRELIGKALIERIKIIKEKGFWPDNAATLIVQNLREKDQVADNLRKIINEAALPEPQNINKYINEFTGLRGSLNNLLDLINDDERIERLLTSSPLKKEGGIDLSKIELTLKDEKYISSLNPAEVKVLRAAKALKDNWNSLSLLYVHEIMLLIKDNLITDLQNKELLLNVLEQLKVKSFLDPQALQFFNLIQLEKPLSEINLARLN